MDTSGGDLGPMTGSGSLVLASWRTSTVTRQPPTPGSAVGTDEADRDAAELRVRRVLRVLQRRCQRLARKGRRAL